MAKQGLNSAIINTAVSGDNIIVAAVAGKKVGLYAVWFVSPGAVAVKFKNGASIDFHPASTIGSATNTGLYLLEHADDPWYETTAGNALILNLGGAVQCSGVAYFLQVP